MNKRIVIALGGNALGLSFQDQMTAAGREAGQAGERIDVCLRSGTGDWDGGYLDFWKKFGFWERM